MRGSDHFSWRIINSIFNKNAERNNVSFFSDTDLFLVPIECSEKFPLTSIFSDNIQAWQKFEDHIHTNIGNTVGDSDSEIHCYRSMQLRKICYCFLLTLNEDFHLNARLGRGL